MHQPFSVAEVIPAATLGKDVVTAVLLHANRVILGTDKGALLVFDLAIASTSSTTLVSRHDGFAKKAIDQLGVIKELNGLLCLSGGDLTLHQFPNFELLSTFAPQTRASASLFVLSTIIRNALPPPKRTSTQPPSSAPEIHSTLAIACKRRLLLFSWIDGAWNPPSELALPHQIRGMAFGEGEKQRKIVAGFSTGEYGIVSLPSPGKSAPAGGAGAGAGEGPTLGELFTPALPPALLAAASATSTSAAPAQASKSAGLGGFGGLAKATGLGALASLSSLGGVKVEKNVVVPIPQKVDKGKKVGDRGGNQEKDPAAWLSGKEWGWAEGQAGEQEVLLVRENLGLPLTVSGKLRPLPTSSTSQTIVHPSAPPQAIIYPTAADEALVAPPYVLTVLPQSDSKSTPALAVHAIDSLNAVQTLHIPPRPSSADSDEESTSTSDCTTTAKFLTAASSAPQPPLIVLTTTSSPSGSEQTLWVVTMRSWESQIEELGQKGAWEEGIRLVRRSGQGGTDLPPRLLRRLAILHSLSLFNERHYDLAIDAFISLDLTPAKIVSLYPEPISGKLFLEDAAKEEVYGGRSHDKVREAIEEAIVAEEQETERKDGDEEGGPATAPSTPTKKKVEDDDNASIMSGKGGGLLKGSKSWMREHLKHEGHGESVDPAVEAQRKAKLEAQNFAKSADVLIRYLTDRRQKYAQALASLLPSSRPSPKSPRPRASGAELLEIPDVPLTELKPDQLARVAQVVDTALFRSYLATKPVMVGPLCRIENWCEVEEVEELLLTAKKYRELLDLYNGKNMHEKAVKLLRQMSEDEDDPEEKVGDTVRYLQKLGGSHVKLIFESSKWVFEVSKSAGLEIFIADLEEVESLPRHDTMHHLEKIGSDVCATYLEHIIHQLGEEGAEFHEKLIELYLAAVHPPNKNPDADEAYRKLLELLESSTSYRADRILGRLPSDDMHQVRAILLGRLGRHEGALQIYVYQLNDHATAEEYCRRVYDSDPSMRSTIFHLLLRIYLRPRPSHPLLFGPALSLISAHASSIDAVEVFELLPPLVALSDLKVFLEKTLRRSGERAREAKIVKGISKSLVEAEEREVVDLEERRVKITEQRVCPNCHKRLGNSVIAIHSPRMAEVDIKCAGDLHQRRNLGYTQSDLVRQLGIVSLAFQDVDASENMIILDRSLHFMMDKFNVFALVPSLRHLTELEDHLTERKEWCERHPAFPGVLILDQTQECLSSPELDLLLFHPALLFPSGQATFFEPLPTPLATSADAGPTPSTSSPSAPPPIPSPAPPPSTDGHAVDYIVKDGQLFYKDHPDTPRPPFKAAEPGPNPLLLVILAYAFLRDYEKYYRFSDLSEHSQQLANKVRAIGDLLVGVASGLRPQNDSDTDEQPDEASDEDRDTGRGKEGGRGGYGRGGDNEQPSGDTPAPPAKRTRTTRTTTGVRGATAEGGMERYLGAESGEELGAESEEQFEDGSEEEGVYDEEEAYRWRGFQALVCGYDFG
ncbi:rab guanyl-nucleotide exchange factor [Pseudohyphozyma bogoriensis]|nr:rab guanyl-nucleotide exchange factor [Pseudohyphozyma bogoriensis]